MNPKTRQCISYTFSKNKQLKTNYGCSAFKNGQYYGNIKNNISTQFSKVLSPPPKAQKVLAVFGDGCTKRETVYTVENGRISSCIKNKYSCGKNTSGADDAWCESKVNSSNNGYLVRACFQDRCWNKNKVVCGNWSPNTSIYRGWTDVTCKLNPRPKPRPKPKINRNITWGQVAANKPSYPVPKKIIVKDKSVPSRNRLTYYHKPTKYNYNVYCSKGTSSYTICLYFLCKQEWVTA